jgi:hypothetical protein
MPLEDFIIYVYCCVVENYKELTKERPYCATWLLQCFDLNKHKIQPVSKISSIYSSNGWLIDPI